MSFGSDPDDKSLILLLTSDEVRLTKPGANRTGYVAQWSSPISVISNIVEIDIRSDIGLKVSVPASNRSFLAAEAK